MPFQSRRQQGKCYALKAKNLNGSWDCSEFSKHTDFTRLPERKRKEAADMSEPVSVIAALGRQAAEAPLVEKFAADTGLAPAALEKLAAAAKLSVPALARVAYAHPDRFAKFARARLAPKVPAKAPAKITGARPAVKTASALELVVVALAERAFEKKAAADRKLSAMTLMNHFLDKVAAALPMTKQASIRVMQAELALGRPLSHAIKKAHPRLSPEQRGFVAGELTKAAADDFAKFVKKKQHGLKTATGKPGDPAVSKLMKSANVGVGTRVLNAGRNMFSSQAAAGRSGREAYLRNATTPVGLGKASGGTTGQGADALKANARQGHAANTAQAGKQAVGDQLKARLAAALGLGVAGGAGGASVLGGGGKAPATPETPAMAMGMGGGPKPQRPPTVRGWG